MCTGVKRAQYQIIPECVSGTGIGWLGDPGRRGDCLENENVPPKPGAELPCFPSLEKLVTLIFRIRFTDHLGENQLLEKSMVLVFLRDTDSERNSARSQVRVLHSS